MNDSIQRGLNLLSPGSVVPVDVKTIADLYAALKYTTEQLKQLRDEVDGPKYRDCQVCKQDVLMLNGTGMHWTCGTCGHREKVEPEEP